GGRLGGGRGGAGADERQDGADLDGLVLLDQDLLERAGDRRGDLGVDLVGRDLEQRLVDGDVVTDLLEPARHGALGDRLAQRGQRDLGGVAATGSGGLGGGGLLRGSGRLGRGSGCLLGGGLLRGLL